MKTDLRSMRSTQVQLVAIIFLYNLSINILLKHYFHHTETFVLTLVFSIQNAEKYFKRGILETPENELAGSSNMLKLYIVAYFNNKIKTGPN